jgi:hypothetical protein
MKIDLKGSSAHLTLDRDELQLLRYALERASFIDTAASEQPKIAAFCSKALELLRSDGRTEPPA